MSMSVGQSSAGGENGYSVFGRIGREAKGCVDAKLAIMPVVLVRLVTRSPRPRFCGDFCPGFDLAEPQIARFLMFAAGVV